MIASPLGLLLGAAYKGFMTVSSASPYSPSLAESHDDTFWLHRGHAPLLSSAPHIGTKTPEALAAHLTPIGLSCPDQDHQVDHLFDFLKQGDGSWLRPVYSRYVIDLNRDPMGAPLYPGRFETGLCPLSSFSGAPIYQGPIPTPSEVILRRARYFAPYHRALSQELARLRSHHGYAILLDLHSVGSVVPSLFEGDLPDINLGSHGGQSADPRLIGPLIDILSAQSDFSYVLDGRFKGGYITRHYGRPASGVHALQFEINKRCYLNEDQPECFDQDRARALQVLLKTLTDQIQAFVPGR